MGSYTLYADKKECCGCGACADACGVGAICMVSDGEGFWYPQINEEKCTGCGRCGEVCQIHRTKVRDEQGGSRIYLGVRAKSEGIRYSSSSGGMFGILAQYIFRRQGVVYGAAFDNEMKVVHMQACDMEQLEKLKKTKYVQSDMAGIYRRIEEQLNEGLWVLFCGTPCQVQGLRFFLRKTYPRLVMADLVCYGVPSPGIWRDYVEYLEKRHGGRLTEFYFRDKRNRDNGHTCAYVAGGTEYAVPIHRNPYCRMYFVDHILRPSCHSCRYCTTERDSDFTIGDFWGIERIRPDMDDGMGTSLVILHSDQAKEIWDSVKDQTLSFVCKEEEILQPRLVAATRISGTRQWFMRCYRLLPIWLLIKMVTNRIYSLFKRSPRLRNRIEN